MRALTYDRYGGPEAHVLRDDEPVPAAAPGEVLVRVEAVGLNPYDWHIFRGDPWLARLAFGLRGPGHRIVGSDVAGTIETIGDGVRGWSPGDRVAAFVGFGGCAALVAVPVDRLARIPEGVAATTAAATPIGALTALAGLEPHDLPRRSRVLVIGASGGVGHMAVQIARVLGAQRVVAVCSGRNAAMVPELGADRVIDYTRESVLDCGERFDVILDTVATTPLRRLRHLIDPGGVYAPAGGLGGGPLLGPAWPMYRAKVAGVTVRHVAVANVAAKDEDNGGDVARVLGWIADGSVRAVVEAALPLEDHVAAFERLESQHVAGKLVLTLP